MRAKLPPPIIMPSGHAARYRLLQTITWIGIAGACAAALVAGAYFNGLEVNWHVFWLKSWWDGGMGHLITSPSWPLYRHGYRDQGEPEVAFLIVGMIFAKRKSWSRRAPLWYMIIAPVLLLALSAAGITGVIWLLNFGIPHLLHEQALSHWYLFAGTLAGGFLLGHIVKPVWRPAGATINGWFVDWSVDRYLVRRQHGNGRIVAAPRWVRHWYTAPLSLRERWMWQVRNNEVITRHRNLPRWAAWALAAIGALFLLLVAYLTVTGFIAHFWIGSGHSVPFLAPAGS